MLREVLRRHTPLATQPSGPSKYQTLQKIEAVDLLPPRTLAAIRIILRTGCRPHAILSAEFAWVQPALLLHPDFDLKTLADPEVYTRLASLTALLRPSGTPLAPVGGATQGAPPVSPGTLESWPSC